MVEKCQGMIESRQLNDAKRFYNQIKEKFMSSDMEPRDKEILYNAIRELYDDVYLAVISSQN